MDARIGWNKESSIASYSSYRGGARIYFSAKSRRGGEGKDSMRGKRRSKCSIGEKSYYSLSNLSLCPLAKSRRGTFSDIKEKGGNLLSYFYNEERGGF